MKEFNVSRIKHLNCLSVIKVWSTRNDRNLLSSSKSSMLVLIILRIRARSLLLLDCLRDISEKILKIFTEIDHVI